MTIDKLINMLFFANPLQGFFTALSVLFVVLMIYAFYTRDASSFVVRHGRLFALSRTHCHIKCRMVKWRAGRD